MSYSLWKAYYEDDFDSFHRLLEASVSSARPRGTIAPPTVVESPSGQFGSSPNVTSKGRRSLGLGAAGAGVPLTKADINSRDATGQTLLHLAASGTTESAIDFATALIDHPLIDLYVQDHESGWTALHRAFYHGNVTLARLMLERDAEGMRGKQTIGLIKVKDREGYGPLDLYGATIRDRTLRPDITTRPRSGSHDDDDRADGENGGEESAAQIYHTDVNCDQLFTFGSNKNANLGFSNEDDRQFPERISLRRPESLLRRFHAEQVEQHNFKWTSHDPTYKRKAVTSSATDAWVEDIPWMVKARPLVIQDVQMAKLHSALITSDPESNLYACGHGQGGRLGTGDEQTRYNFVCINDGALSGKRVVAIALGLNHSVALSAEGEIFSWGNNSFGQLGYSLPRATASEEEPISTIPRQIFGPLKREVILGVAASRIHSVAHAGSALFTFGKNEGQLGIIDSDARSLEIQVTPRRVAASLFATNIAAVSTTDKATVCLLESHDVWVFANYGYARVSFPLEGFTNYFLQKSFRVTTYDHEANKIVKLTCGGDTVCALSSRGEIFTVSISNRTENQASSSTTNPSKIRSAITTPQRVWSPKRTSMAARDVGVDVDGSIILSTEEGSVWKRSKRAKIKDATAAGTGDYKPKDYKFSRIPGLTRVLAVRASSHGAYAAARRDCDVTKTQIVIEDQALWKDVLPILSLRHLLSGQGMTDSSDDLRFWQAAPKPSELQQLRRHILASKDIEEDLKGLEDQCSTISSTKYDAVIATTTSDIRIPVHRFILTGRSKTMRRGFRDLCKTSTFTIPDLAVSEIDAEGRTVIKFQGIDILAIIDLVLYLYTDTLVDFWHFTRNAPKLAYRYRQIRTELMKIATKLELRNLEQAARQMVQPKQCLDLDLALAYQEPAFFYDGDCIIQLEDEEVRAHSAFLRARCPFFEGLFMGRAGGRWMAGRDVEQDITVDLKDINSKTFSLVMQWMYSDCGTELFEDIVSVSADDFLDAVMDVLSAANELLLDRLSQVCQAVLGRFVNVRNVCGLLNAIAPSSVHEFKDAGLEYLCLSLEAALQGHHLNELDDDLLFELDHVVRENQLACMPFAKSERAALELHERHPGLAEAIDRNRRAKMDAMALRAKYSGLDSRELSATASETPSPSQQKGRSKSGSHAKGETDKPISKAKESSKDTMFAMDEELDSDTHSPTPSPSIRPWSKTELADSTPSSLREEVWFDSRGKALPSPKLAPQSATPATLTMPSPRLDASNQANAVASPPWTLAPLPGPKTDMRSIMEQAASGRTSSLSQGLARHDSMPPATPASLKISGQKMSQKDRKRLQHSQQDSIGAENTPARPDPSPTPSPRPASAWQTVPAQRNASHLGPIPGAQKPTSARSTSTPQLTMRQTVANSKPTPDAAKAMLGPAGQTSVPRRGPQPSIPNSPETARSRQPQSPNASINTISVQPIPQSIRHQPAAIDESILGLSMSEIVAQQQYSKDAVKEAVAKRDLHDIQAEQEFEEWWEKESAKAQAAALAATSPASVGKAAGRKKAPRRGGQRGGNAKGERERGKDALASANSKPAV